MQGMRTNKSTMRMIRRAEQELRAEQEKQANMICPAFFVTMWGHGWREKRIMDRINSAVDAMREGTKSGMSIFETLEQETGIEISLDGVRSYHEFAYLSGDTQLKPIDDMQYIYMLRREKMWIPSILIAGLFLALHRMDGWGPERLDRLMISLNEIRMNLGENPEKYAKLMREKTGYIPADMWKEE